MQATRRRVSLLLFVLAVFAAISPAAASVPQLSEPLAQQQLRQADVDRLEAAVLANTQTSAPQPEEELPASSRFSLWWPPAAAYGELLTREHVDTGELARIAAIVPVELPSLPETHVRAFDLFDTHSSPPSNRVSDGSTTGFGLCLVETCGGPSESWLSEDPAGTVDSPSLYAFVGHGPSMRTDPTGMCWSSGGPIAFVQCMTRALRGEDQYEEVLAHESRQAGKRVAVAVAKEAAATAAEEMSPAGVVNGLTSGVGGYDVIRQEKVEGFIPRTLGLASALPGVPSAVRHLGDAATVARHADALPTAPGGDLPPGWQTVGSAPAPNPGNDVPYDPRAIQAELEARYPGQVESRTIAPSSAANAGRVAHPTGILIDRRGFPVFDDIAAFDTRLGRATASTKSRTLHMQEASRQLSAAIGRGEVAADRFNEAQLKAIHAGSEKIPGFTWHHHQDFSRMQLVPSDVHQAVGHTGGFKLWF